MELHRIKYFLSVVKHGSFSRAASICNVSQPSLSQQIQKLEEEVGDALFIRGRNGVRLSEIGQAFLSHAQAIMAEVESANEFVAENRMTLKGPIRLGAIPTIAPYLVPKLIDTIRLKYPESEFEINEDTTDDLIELLRSGAVDFALLSPPTKIDDDVDGIDLPEDELLLTLPTDHPLANMDPVSLDQLKNDRLVLLKGTHCLSKQSEGYCNSAGLKGLVTARSSQIDTLLGMVELGMGLTFTPKMAVGFHNHRKVVHHPIRPNAYFRKIRLVWLRRHLPSRSQKVITDSLRDFRG